MSRGKSSTTPVVTVLTSVSLPGALADKGKMHKAFSLDNAGRLKVVPYQNAFFFKPDTFRIFGIDELGRLIATISTDPRKIVIRGLHQSPKVAKVRRRKDNFPEHPEGTPWVMIDFDDIDVPEAVDPLAVWLNEALR